MQIVSPFLYTSILCIYCDQQLSDVSVDNGKRNECVSIVFLNNCGFKVLKLRKTYFLFSFQIYTAPNGYIKINEPSIASAQTANGTAFNQNQQGTGFNDDPNRCKTSYEEVPLHTACLTYLGFYLLMILGYINQLLFAPKVAKEENREVRE